MTVRWGVLGAGSISRGVMCGVLSSCSGASLDAVASRDLRRTRAVAKAFGIPTAHKNYESLLADPDIDAVYIGLANDAHAPYAIAALDAGKHVLCEKPLGLTVAEVDEMVAAAEANERLLVEASWYRWHPRVLLAQRLLHTLRAVGQVRYVSAGFSFSGVAPDNYRLEPAKGGGALYDVGCYAASAALWAFGTPPRSVSAKTDVGPTGVDLTASVTVTFDGGEADIRASIAEDARQWLVVVGDTGELELRDSAFATGESQETTLRCTSAEGTTVETVPPANAYRLMAANVTAAIAGDPDAYVVPLTESRLTASVIEAAYGSSSSGSPYSLVTTSTTSSIGT